MGRYYNGDIDGKWWFGVQSSTTPERFGAEPSFVEYTICNDDDFKDEMKELKKGLGDKRKMFKKFFEKKTAYNDEMLMEFFKPKYPKYTDTDLRKDLSEYADYEFGLKVIKHFKDNDDEVCLINSEL